MLSNIRVRQPLNQITIVMNQTEGISEFEDLIKDELNVKEVIFATNLVDFASLKLSINFPILGKRLPNKMKDIISASKLGNWSKDSSGLSVAGEMLEKDEYNLLLEPHVKNGAKNLNSNDGLVMLDLSINHELYLRRFSKRYNQDDPTGKKRQRLPSLGSYKARI
jgi:isoleucyl-tRNA synthetase